MSRGRAVDPVGHLPGTPPEAVCRSRAVRTGARRAVRPTRLRGRSTDSGSAPLRALSTPGPPDSEPPVSGPPGRLPDAGRLAPRPTGRSCQGPPVSGTVPVPPGGLGPRGVAPSAASSLYRLTATPRPKPDVPVVSHTTTTGPRAPRPTRTSPPGAPRLPSSARKSAPAPSVPLCTTSPRATPVRRDTPALRPRVRALAAPRAAPRTARGRFQPRSASETGHVFCTCVHKHPPDGLRFIHTRS